MESSKRGQVAPFIVMDVMRAANEREAQGHKVIHMEVGQPGTPAPALVREAAVHALASDKLGYAEALGLPALRARIARHYEEAYGVDVSPSQVVVTSGSSGGFQLAFLAAFDAGARIALAMPAYPAYRNILKALDLEPVPIRTDAETGYQLTATALEEAASGGQLDGVLIASPANPTGAMIPPAELKAIGRVAQTRNLVLISDEIYHRLTYGTVDEATALAASPDAIVVNSFSKYYSMTGWRIGWMVVPEPMVRPIERLAQNLFISVPTLSQLAAIHAFDAADELDRNLDVYRANRALLLDGLPQAGFDRLAPSDGAFYIYADVSGLTDDSEALCQRLLMEADIAVTPGTDFDPEAGRTTLRFSFAGPTDHMREAVARLKALNLRKG
ncbi:aminotransferase class I/II-fold pyridoxal phosphate-dependent enzyme [Pyruvatibacter mobilis]|uniref:Aminotransferase n=1 Tax=Pyruvatibacter mobilis TaxID=1712261 RepID=A0A845QAK1_9HYPH|nr:pyridoxal phosphate-dependent aminotransferase [Pyruvatibacter mobilis]NBG95562.1 aminotransferase class I/II-fold pyridoxal phosphate-dependent enzyme [Pyruvatibacter mobilis]QJD75362.1 pyridoxal phosphate-dependent aminotransferase [Pyruvatibacter mobilis]GGD14927.1 aminotransferase [Pyruvatibacter mobilis]